MGRYQQWLQYQEIHKHLSSQVEALEVELAELHDCLDKLGQHQEVASFTDNPIMQALMAHIPFQAVPLNSNAKYTLETNNPPETGSDESGDSISLALRSRGELPYFELYELREPMLFDNQPSSFFNHSEIELLPEDMIAFFGEHEQTDPQLELPWWLRNITVSSKDEQAGRPIDHNSIRTNRLVQRWIERWGRQSSTALESAENKQEGSGE
jgi:hypothetical protein